MAKSRHETQYTIMVSCSLKLRWTQIEIHARISQQRILKGPHSPEIRNSNYVDLGSPMDIIGDWKTRKIKNIAEGFCVRLTI